MNNKNEAAFPREWSKIKQSKDAPEQISVAQKGLTKREYFAAMAMQGLVANSRQVTLKGCKSDNILTMSCYLADELLKELEKTF
jgi:hypothetical protein